ncbi:hypothetical protein ACFL0M_05045, partial [Thermodesulfobacteriota bacterium]
MDFERYYLDLFEMLNTLCKKIASGQYGQSDTDKLFELTKKNRYPGLFAELSEAFGMMMVKVEAREFRLEQIIEDLKKAKDKLEDYSQSLEHKVSASTEELQKKNAQLEEEIQKRRQEEEKRLKLEKLKPVSETIGGVCHDLNQPLQSISGNAELLMLNITEDHPHYRKIKNIMEQADR